MSFLVETFANSQRKREFVVLLSFVFRPLAVAFALHSDGTGLGGLLCVRLASSFLGLLSCVLLVKTCDSSPTRVAYHVAQR